MTSNLYNLVYFSRNTLEGTNEELKAHVAQILAAARRNNPGRGVTGALLFSQGCFTQVLEGTLEDVEAVFNRIEDDPRHCDVRVLQFKQIGARNFTAWSMAYAGRSLPGAGGLDVEGLTRDTSRIASGEAGQCVVDVLKEMMGEYDSAVAAE